MKETSCSILRNIFVPLPQVMKKEKFYVVWAGGTPGIYTSWTDCQLQTKGYEGAKYKSFDTREEAEKAFASSPYDYIKRNASTGSRKSGQSHDTDAPYPTAVLENSLAVDAACSGNPGKNCSGHNTGASRPGSNDSGCSDQIRPPDAGIIKRYFRVPALQAAAGGASCLKMLPVSAES